jgi:hypothetical protein
VKIQGHVGGIEKTARIYSNDPQSDIEILTLKANIRQSVQALPTALMFQGQEGAVQTQSVDIMSSEDKPLDIKPSSFNLKDKLTYRIEEVQKGKHFRIYFTNVPDASGYFNGFLILTTNYDDTPEIRISLNGTFQKNIGINDKK